MFAFLKYFQFVFLEHHHIDATCCLESFVVVVEIVMDLDSEDQAAEKESVDVKPTQREVLILDDVSIHDDDGHDQTLRGKSCEFMDTPEVVFQIDLGYLLGIKYGLRLGLLLFAVFFRIGYQVFEERGHLSIGQELLREYANAVQCRLPVLARVVTS